jgi:hypothetical protein
MLDGVFIIDNRCLDFNRQLGALLRQGFAASAVETFLRGAPLRWAAATHMFRVNACQKHKRIQSLDNGSRLIYDEVAAPDWSKSPKL